MPKVTVRYWAAAKEAAGAAEEVVEARTLADALAAVSASRAHEEGRFARVLARSSFLIDGTHASAEAMHSVLPDEAVVEVLPPFAGG
jgi:molybdopterin synthase sulfur carrier subunit